MKIHAIIHGRSKRRKYLSQELTRIAEGNHDLNISLTEHHMHAEQMARDSTADLIISCGGDGTNNEVVNGLMSKASDQIPMLALVKAGSGNDFLRTVENNSLETIIQNAVSRNSQKVDLIQILFQEETRYALNMCTCGISGSIAKTVNDRKFKLPPALNYYSAIIQWLLKYNSPKLTLATSSATSNENFYLVACGNGKFAGNGLGLSPQSDAFNGSMGLTTIGDVRVFDFLRYQSTLKKGLQIDDPRVHYAETQELHLAVASGELDVEADGETIGTLGPGLNITIRILPSAISLLT